MPSQASDGITRYITQKRIEKRIARAGRLPTIMPVSLETLDLSGGNDPYSVQTPHKFTGNIPAEWSSMTNLKELKMVDCGLDGECLVYVQANIMNDERNWGARFRTLAFFTRNVPRAFL